MGLRDSELGFFSVLPAYAGMIPADGQMTDGLASAPRIRGDDPANSSHSLAVVQCSPHTRG